MDTSRSTVIGIAALLATLVVHVASNTVLAQTEPPAAEKVSSVTKEAGPIVSEIAFAGLRRVPPATLRAHLSSRENEPLDDRRVKDDLRALARLGWFGNIRAETSGREDRTVRLLFLLDERPFLAKVDFSGSRLLSRQQIDHALAEKQIALRLAAPANPGELHRAARAVESALAELGHPRARVVLRVKEVPTATVRAHFTIMDGPRIFVAPVAFAGSTGFPEKRLRRQMRRIAPHALFASLRSKNVYTPERLNEDRERLLAYYQNHGYPEARIGAAQVTLETDRVRKWFPWPHRKTVARYHIAIPVEAGTLYRLAPVDITDALVETALSRKKATPPSFEETQPGQPYSAEAVERLRRAWRARVELRPSKDSSGPVRDVEVTQRPNSSTQTVRVKFDLRESQPYIVRRIEFLGTRRFSDCYYRRRALVEEGQPLDEQTLEAGLARLARTGYIRPIKKDDIHIRLDDARHTAEVSIRVEEIGQQRVSLVGGHAAFGSTIGIAYTVFDLLGGEELLTAHLEGGPQSLQVLLGVAKEGFLGTRSSLALSVFHNLVRPRLAGGSSPLFTSQSTGFNAGWSYAASHVNSFDVNYNLSQTLTRYPVAPSPELTGVPNPEVRAVTSSRSVGLGWTRDTERERFLANTSVSGGVLGGNENLLRSSMEYARVFPDPIFRQGSAWAFRGTVTAAGSTKGDMPLYARLFAGDESVRGFRPGELGSYAVVKSTNATGAETFRGMPAGANVVAAWNTEYRVPLTRRSEAVGFFDLGAGRLLPNWLGPARPALLAATNGVVRGSTGLELRYTVPGVEIPVRVNYAVNVLRLRGALRLPDGSVFRASDRRSAFGWALGSLF